MGSNSPNKGKGRINRRKILRRTGAGLLGGGLLSSTATANGGKSDQVDPEESGAGKGSSMTLTESNSLDRNEYGQYLQRMRDKYGDMAAGITPRNLNREIELVPQQQTPTTTNLTWENAWNDEYGLSAGCCGEIAYTDHALTLYSGEAEDNNGRTIYILWQWSQSEAYSPTGYTASTTTLRNHANFTSSDVIVSGFNPSSTKDKNGRTYDVGINVGYGGITMGLNGEVYLSSGSFGPDTGKVDTGRGGEYAVEFNGCQAGITGVNGAIDARSYDLITNGEIDWNVYAYADIIC